MKRRTLIFGLLLIVLQFAFLLTVSQAIEKYSKRESKTPSTTAITAIVQGQVLLAGES